MLEENLLPMMTNLQCPPSSLRDSPLQSANDEGGEGSITKKDSFDPCNALVHGIVPEEWMAQESSSNLDFDGGGGSVWVDLPSKDVTGRILIPP
eukprot:1705356-Ditylum_brightwellii.AAC.1